jgi:phage/plasmid primase-like uncharacterized protein
MIAAVSRWPGRQTVAIQRTWLSEGEPIGKGHIDPARMSLGPCACGAVRLGPAAPEMVVGEGVETVLSVQASTGMPGWAVLGACNLPNLVLPPLPNAAELIVAVDDDDDNGDGQHGADLAALRWSRQGRRVRLAHPGAGQDFNDVLRRSAA